MATILVSWKLTNAYEKWMRICLLFLYIFIFILKIHKSYSVFFIFVTILTKPSIKVCLMNNWFHSVVQSDISFFIFPFFLFLFIKYVHDFSYFLFLNLSCSIISHTMYFYYFTSSFVAVVFSVKFQMVQVFFSSSLLEKNNIAFADFDGLCLGFK